MMPFPSGIVLNNYGGKEVFSFRENFLKRLESEEGNKSVWCRRNGGSVRFSINWLYNTGVPALKLKNLFSSPQDVKAWIDLHNAEWNEGSRFCDILFSMICAGQNIEADLPVFNRKKMIYGLKNDFAYAQAVYEDVAKAAEIVTWLYAGNVVN